MSEDRFPPEGESEPKTPDSASGAEQPTRFWPLVRWLAWRAAGVLGGFIMLMLVLTASAGWYTSRPEFCRSCHIMEPYYVSWQESSHKDVSCIKCHFPPGFAEKVRGKMLGLVQLTKYITQSEGPRPAAEIPDASCLRSGCHETRLLSGRVDFNGVPFDHEPHLTSLRRGKKLRCTSCHSQIMQGSHMAVTTSTCFLCHFKEGLFNEGLGACTRCHQIPDDEFQMGGDFTFSHDLAYEKGVDCENCHGDLIRGDGAVPRERCQVCHNREDHLDRIDDHVFIHKLHVTDHKVDCLDCHLHIEHSLDHEKIEHAAADCQSCHPDHHHEQVDMLQGLGGKSIPPHAAEMPVARVECRSCHRFKEVSGTGTVLWRASVEVCTNCHDLSDSEALEAYHLDLRAALDDIESGLENARTALESASPEEDRAAEMAVELEDLQGDLSFLRAANGIHNIHYASTLTRAVVDQLASICRELQIEAPEVVLPESIDGFD